MRGKTPRRVSGTRSLTVAALIERRGSDGVEKPLPLRDRSLTVAVRWEHTPPDEPRPLGSDLRVRNAHPNNKTLRPVILSSPSSRGRERRVVRQHQLQCRTLLRRPGPLPHEGEILGFADLESHPDRIQRNDRG